MSAVLAAVLVAAALVAGCGGGSSKSNVAARAKTLAAQDKALATQFNKLTAQDKAVEGINHLTAAQARVALNHRRLVEAIRRRWEARGIAVATAGQAARRLVQGPIPRGQTVSSQTFVEVSGFSAANICAPIGPRGATMAQRLARRARELQRKQALYDLNLSCGSQRSQ